MAQLYFKVGSDWEEVVRLRNECEKLESQLLKMDRSKAPGAVAALETQLGSAKQRMEEMVSEAALAGAVMENDFKKKIHDASKGVNGFSQKIIDQKRVIKDIEQDLRNLSDEYRKFQGTTRGNTELADYNSAKKVLQEEKNALFDLTQQQAEARLSVKKLRDEYSLYKDDAKDVVNTNEGIGISLKKALAVLGGAAVVKSLISNVVKVRGEFQLMDTAIETLLGNKEKADALMIQVKEYARLSPLELKDVSAATQMMLGFNIEAEKVPRFLSAIGDISMGESQKFNSLTLAFSQMSAAGKLMGQDLNQMINAGFNPLSVMSEKTGKSIAQLKDEMSKGAISADMVQQAFINATEAGGKFYNMSENASKTINGQLSMFNDALDAIYNEIGTKGEGVIIGAIQSATSLVENYETVGKVLVGLIATYGLYRTAILLTTLENGKYIITLGKLSKALHLAEIKQNLLNAAVLKNPYALAAVALGIFAFGIYKLVTAETAAETAQRKHNEAMEAAKEKKENLISKTQQLINKINDETQTIYAQIKAWKELQKEMPEAFANMSMQEFKNMKPEDRDKLINKTVDDREINDAEEKLNQLAEYLEAYLAHSRLLINGTNEQIQNSTASLSEVIKELKAAYPETKDFIFGGSNKEVREYVELLKQEKVQRDEMLKQGEFEAKTADEKVAILNVQLKQYQDQYAEIEKLVPETERVADAMDALVAPAVDNVEKSLFNLNDEWGKFDWQTKFNLSRLDFINGKINEINSTITGITTANENGNYGDAYAAAKKEWEAAKKGLAKIEKDKDNFTKKQHEDAKLRKETAEDAYKKLGGITGNTLTKQENQAEKLRKEQEKYKVLIEKQKLEHIRAEEDLQMQADQARIDGLIEGSEKYIAQMELNYKKEKQAVDRQKEDLLRKKIEDARAEHEADPAKKGKTFEPTGISLTKSEIEAFDAMYKAVIESREKTEQKAQLESMREYLKEYGTFQQQKLAIAEEYAEKIRLAEAQGNKAEVMRLQKQQQSAIENVDVKAIEAQIDWYSVFDGVGLVLESQLRPLLGKLQKYTSTDKFQNSSAENQKAIVDAIANIRNQIGSNTDIGWKDLAASMTSYQQSLMELQIAEENRKKISELLTKSEERLNKAKQSGNSKAINEEQATFDMFSTAAKNASIVVDNATTKVASNSRVLSQTAKDVTQPISEIYTFLQSSGIPQLGELWGSFDKLKGGIDALKALDEVGKAAKEVGDSGKKIADGAKGAGEALDDSGEVVTDALSEGLSKAGVIGQIIAAILKILDILKDGIGKLVADLLDTIFDAIAGIIDNILSGDIFVQIFKSLANGISKIFDAISFGGFSSLTDSLFGGNAKETVKKIERLTTSNEALKTSIDGLRDEIKGTNGAKSIQAYNEAIEAQRKYEKNLQQILNAQMRYTNDHRSNAHNWNLEKNSINQINALLGTNLRKDQWKDFAELTADQMNAIRTHLPEIWTEMLNEGKYKNFGDDWNNYADQAGVLSELTADLYENLTQISFDSLRDSFVDALMDMDKSAEDFAKDFEEYMTKALLNFAIGGELDDGMKKWYEDWAKDMQSQKGELTDTQIDSYRSRWEDFVNEGLAIRDQIANLTGYTGDSSTSSQESTKRGFETMSQDTGNELNGRFTALQMAGEEIKQQSFEQTMKLADIKGSIDLSNYTLSGISNIADETRTILANSYLELQGIRENTEAVIKPIKQIASDIADVKRNTAKL